MTEIEILKKALDLINAKGYAQVGMRELARDLNISPGNLTYYFKKKEDVLAALLNQFSSLNTQTIEAYLHREPSNSNFLKLLQDIFGNQFMYRGVYVGNQFFSTAIVENKIFDYQSVFAKRKSIYQEIFIALHDAGQLNLRDEDVSFLVSFITLFGRFWITEATLFDKSPNPEEVIPHYVQMLAKQLSLFSTEAGLESIQEFSISNSRNNIDDIES